MKLTKDMLKKSKMWNDNICSEGIRSLMDEEFDNIEVYESLIKTEKKNNCRSEISVYDFSGNEITSNKKSFVFLTENLIRIGTFDNKFGLYDTYGVQLLPFEYSVIELVISMEGYKFLRIQRSETEHGLYNLQLEPIIPCGNNFIYYKELETGGPVRVKWDQKDMISYLIVDGKLKVVY